MDAAGGMGPVQKRERVAALDAVRGFAILGILLVNIELFRGPQILLSFAGAEGLTGADAAVSTVISIFAESKFITTLAFLFGLGFALQGMRAEERGRSPGRLLARRLAVLALFGVLHAVFVWSGDILLTYALIGLLFLLFYRRRPRTMTIWAGVFLALPLLLTTLVAVLALLAPSGGEAAPQIGFLVDLGRNAEVAYTSGSYPQMVIQRLRELAIMLPLALFGAGAVILCMMLLGGAVARAGWPADLASHGRALRFAATAGILVGLPLNAAYALSLRAGTDPVATLGLPLFVVGAPLLAIGYMANIVLLVQRFPNGVVTRRLAAVGRLALTNYLSQSIVMTAIFYGLGLYGSVSLATAVLIAAALLTLQLVLSPIYLSRFDQGPAEWLWRRLTYGRPFSK
jgi:uncharacterized protein